MITYLLILRVFHVCGKDYSIMGPLKIMGAELLCFKSPAFCLTVKVVVQRCLGSEDGP